MQRNFSNVLKEQHRVKRYSHKGEICGRTCLTTTANATSSTAPPFTHMVLVEGMSALADEFGGQPRGWAHSAMSHCHMLWQNTNYHYKASWSAAKPGVVLPKPFLHTSTASQERDVYSIWCALHGGNWQIAPLCKYYLINELVADFTFCQFSKVLIF